MKTMPTKTALVRGPVGIVGLGLMGRDIAACLLSRGITVVGFDNDPHQAAEALPHLEKTLAGMLRRKLITREGMASWKRRFQLAESIAQFKGCELVIEAVPENMETKKQIFDALESVVSRRSIIASNTSSFPITLLQQERKHPDRFIGMHWAEPAQIMRYLEITPGRQTSPRTVKLTRALGEHCGKEPTVLKQDIRGFLSNRLMYAMLREAFHLVEAGIADVETVDRSFRNDIGWWATFAGPFRWMDLTGIPAYAAVMDGLLPELSQSTEVPKLMSQTVKRGARGISNQKGFYKYTAESSRQWDEAWVEFTYDVKKLAEKYQAVQS
jgi:3-hydroxybutyryl-CoA dehydrogenase